MESRYDREKQFHDVSYEENVRKPLDKFYAITAGSTEYYRRLLARGACRKRILEYGCGVGDWALELARCGATVTGIDLSDTAIAMAKTAAREANLDVDFHMMNAEALTFEDGFFDVICGTAILHHLNPDKAYAELARTLKPDGRAIFLEPLGHNVLLNLYRRLTPNYRTVDEHPFRKADLALAKKYFTVVQTRSFHLASMAAIPFRSTSMFPGVLRMLEATDRMLFMMFPFLQMQAWIVIVTMSGPKTAGAPTQGAMQ